MTTLPTWQRGAFRATVLKWLKDTAKIEVQQSSKGTMNEPLDAWTIVTASVACRVIGAEQSDAAFVGSQETIADMYRLVVPAGTALAANQRVTVTSTGYVYQVVGFINDLTDELFRTAVILRRRG